MTLRCPELAAELLGLDEAGPDGAGDSASLRAAHQATCAVCQRGLAVSAHVRDTLQRSETPLDDVTRARVSGRLAALLDAEADAEGAGLRVRGRRRASGGRGGGRWLWPALVGTAAIAAAAAAWVARERGAGSPTVSARAGGPTAGPSAPLASGQPVVASGVLTPYYLAGDGAALVDLLGRPQIALAVPPNVRMRVAVGDRARVTLIGPARLAVEQVTGQHIRLALTTGTLLGDYDHSAGGSLEIRSPGALTTIVGTLFAVEASGGGSRVSVAHGRVSVLAHGRSSEVGQQRTLEPDGAAAELARSVASALAEHEASPPAPRGEWGTIALSGAPALPGVAVFLGERQLGEAPLWALAPVGDATVEVRAPGRAAVALRTTVRARQASTLAFALPDSSATGAPGSSTSATTAPPTASASPAPAAASASGAGAAGANGDGSSSRSDEDPAETTYARAEAAMRDGDLVAARATLLELIRRFPRDPLAAAARYDLARLAFRAGDHSEATRQLDALGSARPSATLAEMASYLRCRVALQAGHSADATRCLSSFRSDHPSSPHDAEALALLAELARADCTRARPLLVEYLERYPGGPFASEAIRREARCAH
ncbi:MAG: tetratricopeptide repeat protein [Deltaproteobacteria bacterium]|nr:tetratricopeptide repeat protein [Deltaproteobacteria bacterium]